MKKFYIETYGCQMNVADSEIVTTILSQNGFSEAKTIDEADFIIFNTCSVRQHAEDRVIGRISNEMARKLINPDLRIGIIGCMAQRLGKKINDQVKGIDFSVGVDNYRQLPEILRQLIENEQKQPFFELNDLELYNDCTPLRKNDLNAFITIMRGCNNYCSYCIVPYLRGNERSRPLPDIISEAENAGAAGIKEITLLGQNVNSYRWERADFPELLQTLNTVETIERIRFITSHPKDLSDKLIDVMASCKKVCEHLHLPLQSGDDSVLQKMNRDYTFSHYISIIDKLRKNIPSIAITTDLIAGFPGETEEHFQNTINAMSGIRFDFAFMFRYSPREGTAAYNFVDDVPEKIKLERLDRMIKLQTDITNQVYKSKIGETVEVIVEKKSKKSAEELSGKSRDFKIVVFPGDEKLIGSIQKVKVTDATGWTLKGHLIDQG